MFNNFVKWSTGKTNVRVIALVLAIILTFTNFAILGTYLTESIASDNSGSNATNVDNVKFSVSLDEEDASKTSISADINSEELNLYLALKIENGGSLEKAKLNFANSNFKLKNSDSTEVNIGNFEGEEIYRIPIVARRDNSYNLDLLNMESSIVLTGEYVDDDNEVTEVESTKNVNIEWTTNEVTDEEVNFLQELITNKEYNVNGVNKRIVQVLVKANVKDNKVPVSAEKIEIEVPTLNDKLEDVKVVAKTTKATNGKTDIEFTDDAYEYNNETGILTINVLNAAQENVVFWEKDVQDEYIVTYIYEEDAEVAPFVSNANVTFNIYGRTEEALHSEYELSLETVEETGEIISLEKQSPDKLYKGYMYAGEDTTYETNLEMFVSYSGLLTNIEVNDFEQAEGLASYYKTTKIEKTQALDLLGAEGIITINSEDMEDPQIIRLAGEMEEDYYEIIYPNNVSRITLSITNPLKEGKLNLVNEKVLKVIDEENLEQKEEIDTIAVLNAKNLETNITINKEGTIDLEEPVTTIGMNLNKKLISNQVEDSLRATVELKSSGSSNKLFKNPTINIELPEEITNVTIENVSLSNGNQLAIDGEPTIKTSESGNKVLEVKLSGEQTEYVETLGEATIVADLKLEANPFMADKNVEIKATCINDGENAEAKANLKIKAKDGLLKQSFLTVDDKEIKGLNAQIEENSQINVKLQIINNFGKEISNVSIRNEIPEGLELISTNNAQEEFLEQEKTLGQGKMLELVYILKAGEDLAEVTEDLENELIINYTLNEEQKEEKITYTFTKEDQGQSDEIEQNETLELKLKDKANSQTLHEGQIVTYVVSVKNLGEEALNNLKLQYQIPEGATYTELTYAQGYEITYTNNEGKTVQEWNIETLNPGEVFEKEVTIKIKQGTTGIENTAKVINGNNETAVEITKTAEVKDAELEVLLSRRENLNVTFVEGDLITYTVIVKNVSQNKLNNVTVKCYVPENTTLIEDSEYNQNWTFNSEERAVYYTIAELDKLAPGEAIYNEDGNQIIDESTKGIKVLSFEVRIDNYQQDVQQAKIDNNAVVTIQNEDQYTSNVFTSNLKMARYEISQTSEHASRLKEGDSVKYIITVKNVGEIEIAATIIDNVPDRIQLRSLKIYLNDELINEENVFSNNELSVTNALESGNILKIEIEGVTYDLEYEIEQAEIRNIAKIALANGEYLESNAIENTIIREIPEIPENPNNPGDPSNPDDPENPDNPDNPEDPNKLYSISGLAWKDLNKNGIMEEGEETLKGITVILLDEKGNTVQDKEGSILQTQTTITGTYKFVNLPQGKYLVAFVYNDQEYSVTKYQVKDATLSTNSDAIEKTIALDNVEQKVALTDVINLNKEDATNINVGLINKEKFDLKLDKYISKVIVTNSSGTTTYSFDDETNFTKVEIGAKNFAGSTIIVEYNLVVTNEGDVNGYIGDIIDYLPKELSFSTEMNKNWYIGTDNNLHFMQENLPMVEPGKSQTIKLVLTKTLSSDSAGTIKNIAEIGESSNLAGLKELDSTVANNKAGEDDISTATLIISIKTGSLKMYIEIVLASLVILGAGIYLVNKKVLKGGI